MPAQCEKCGQPLPEKSDAVSTISAWCRDNGVPVILGDRLRLDDAARLLGWSRATLYRALNDSDLRSVTLRGRRYVTLDSLAQFSEFDSQNESW